MREVTVIGDSFGNRKVSIDGDDLANRAEGGCDEMLKSEYANIMSRLGEAIVVLRGRG